MMSDIEKISMKTQKSKFHEVLVYENLQSLMQFLMIFSILKSSLRLIYFSTGTCNILKVTKNIKVMKIKSI